MHVALFEIECVICFPEVVVETLVYTIDYWLFLVVWLFVFVISFLNRMLQQRCNSKSHITRTNLSLWVKLPNIRVHNNLIKPKLLCHLHYIIFQIPLQSRIHKSKLLLRLIQRHWKLRQKTQEHLLPIFLPHGHFWDHVIRVTDWFFECPVSQQH